MPKKQNPQRSLCARPQNGVATEASTVDLMELRLVLMRLAT